MKTSEIIQNEARLAGLCDAHFEGWNHEWGIPEMIDYYLENVAWCMKHNFPSYEIANKYFNTDAVRKKGVFIDASVTARATLPTYVFFGCEVGMIVNDVCTIHLRDNSKSKIIVDSGGILMVNIYDDSEVSIETRGSGHAIVNLYGNIRPTTAGNNIKCRKKHL